MTVQDILAICEKTSFGYYGLRADDMDYQVGDICENSHQLFQDRILTKKEDLIYEELKIMIARTMVFYDAGELDGTCAVKFNPDDEGKYCCCG